MHFYVLRNRQMIEKIVGLSQEADRTRPKSRALGLGPPCHPPTADRDGPAIRLVEPGQAGEQSRLAAPGRTHECDGLAALDRQTRPAQGAHFGLSGMIKR